MFLTGYLQPPTAPVQLLGFPFTWFLHVSYRPPFFHLHCFYMFLTGPLFSFTWFLCFLQAPFFHLHGFYMFLTGPLFFIYMLFTCFLQAPFFHLHAFYMFLTGPLFSFTWFLHVVVILTCGYPSVESLTFSWATPHLANMRVGLCRTLC